MSARDLGGASARVVPCVDEGGVVSEGVRFRCALCASACVGYDAMVAHYEGMHGDALRGAVSLGEGGSEYGDQEGGDVA